MSAPLILCHYGNSKYLPYVFEAVRLTNPDKEIYLLGDSTNRWIGDLKGISHVLFEDYSYGNEIETFDRVYRLIQGKRHNNIKFGRDWVNFVFKRWFYVSNFLISRKIKQFWHFDSDNMILDSLTAHESKFQSYDCTEQCNGICMNGYISSPLVVRKYIQKINDLFQDEEYLAQQKMEFEDQQEDWAFTEMRAYKSFKNDGIQSIKLSSIIEGSTFDDCICQVSGMEMERLVFGREIKKVYLGSNGRFYCVDRARDEVVRMNSLNLSWVPIELFPLVLGHLRMPSDTREEGNLDVFKFPTLGEAYRKRYIFRAAIKKARTVLGRVGRRSVVRT